MPSLRFALSAVLFVVTPIAESSAQADPVRFNRDIRPLLSDRCFKCHGFDAQARKAGLRLDTRDGLTTPVEGRVPVVPGDADASELIRRVSSDDARLVMPPPDSGLTLNDDERALLRRWIDEGADFEAHWAFVPPTAPEIPSPRRAPRSRNPIDHFIQAELERNGLALSPDADRETLIRRASLDLTGLPPTLAELDAFLADDRDDAYERLVDRLLASPRFGERMALVWLDAARYADTNGYHHDNVRTAWPYRDWVIGAFNDNKPFDEFVVEQLAGDLLPEPSEQQRIATAFCRMHNINDEGGALDAEYRVEAVADRIETIATTFLGLTMTCARCHDHKYDPLTQEDYYSLYAYFGSVEERGVYPNNGERARAYPPRLDYFSAEQRAELDAARTAHATAARELDAATPSIAAELATFERSFRAERGVNWLPIDLAAAGVETDGAKLETRDDGSVRVFSDAASETITLTLRAADGVDDLRLIRLDALADAAHADGRVGLATNGNAVVSSIDVEAVSVSDPNRREPIEIAWAWADDEQPNGDYDVHNLVAGTGHGWALGGHVRDGDRTAILVAAKPFGFAAGGTDVRVTIHCASRYANHVVGRPRVMLGRVRRDAEPSADFPIVASDWWSTGPFTGKTFDDVWNAAHGPSAIRSLDVDAKFGKAGKKGWKHRPELTDGTVHRLRGERRAFYFARTLRTPVARALDLSLGSDDSIRVFLNGAEIHANRAQRGAAPDQDRITVELPAGENVLVLQIVNNGGPGGFYYRAEPTDPDGPSSLAPLAWFPSELRTVDQERRFVTAWGNEMSPTFRRLDAAVTAAAARVDELEGDAVPVLVMQELEKPKATFVLTRGAYDGADESRPVTRRPPTVLGTELPPGAPNNRLGFARWLVAGNNPLTARVHVNRIWQTLFGAGIVATTENFGQQADWPSHPALLDWLAVQFVASGWDQKALIKTIVTSSTYRQSAVVNRRAQQIDPANRWLAFFPRRRLQGELVRDLALAVAGALVPRIGGPSVKPYQPAGLWREVSIGASSNTQVFRRDDGDALYRRSLYTFWKRTSPSPQMATFDAPTREFCLVRRNTTNTPLQALVLWNDEQFVEAARLHAQRTRAEFTDTEDRLVAMFRRCTGRTPEHRELRVLHDALTDFLARYSAAPADARALLELGDAPLPTSDGDAAALAAWTMLASTLLSLDETIVVD